MIIGSNECPRCGARVDVDQSSVGQNTKCPKCGTLFEAKNPNLVPCPDCFGPVSRRASTCPHCGAPLLAGCRAPDDAVSEEEVILVCHPSAKNYLGTMVIGILTLPVLVGAFLLLYVWIETHYTVYRITNLRIIVKQGWIAKLQKEIWIKDMRSVNLVQSTWRRLIGVGDIFIGTAATSETEICMVGIGKPQTVVDTINRLRH